MCIPRALAVIVLIAACRAPGVATESARGAARNVAAVTKTILGTGDPTIAAAGDIACAARAETACQDAATASLVEKLSPTLVLALGDLQYPDGRLQDFRAHYDRTWGRFLTMTRAVPGNHEYHLRDAVGYFDYLNGSGEHDGPAGMRGKGFYSFDVGAWHLVGLNSNCRWIDCGPASEQARWLRADLSAHAQRCTLAYWHHPRFSSGKHGDAPRLQPLWAILVEHGVELLLTGHDHHYERFAPLDAQGRPSRTGVRQFVVGTGGFSQRPVAQNRDGSEVRGLGFGVLSLTLRSDRYDWEFAPISPDGPRDKGSDACRGARPQVK